MRVLCLELPNGIFSKKPNKRRRKLSHYLKLLKYFGDETEAVSWVGHNKDDLVVSCQYQRTSLFIKKLMFLETISLRGTLKSVSLIA